MTPPLRTVDFRIAQSYVTSSVQLATSAAERCLEPSVAEERNSLLPHAIHTLRTARILTPTPYRSRT